MSYDFQQYSALIENIYEFSQSKSNWYKPLQELRDCFSANYVTLILKPTFENEEEELGLMIAIGSGISAEKKVQYLPYRYHITPFNNQRPDTVFTVDDLMDEEAWIQSTYRKYWCANIGVYHVMSADISTIDGGLVKLRITRPESQDNFSDEDKALCQLLITHLKRALDIHHQLDRSNSIGSMYNEAISRLSIATVQIDESGRILEQNVFASELLLQEDGLKVQGGKLTAHYPNDNRELKQLIADSFKMVSESDRPMLPEAMSIARPSGEVNLGVVVEVIPSPAWQKGTGQGKAVVYIRDSVAKSQASSHVAKKIFGLTSAETALTLQLANGLSLEEAAEVLNIRRNTARAHLRSIFSKTGVRRQTELVRILLNSVAPLACKETDINVGP
ncbi:helix-turn-helix transcriptional regulator [Vibrio sinensis]|uniref:Helix-turn-helix transcriptional regulator n=1 Tax=Vibrio sinensis TaxID=2302434 RepID=A0A3A6QF32_9VIBR|nr:helix-turn-helix transcriptional regulator [Vibrio sinensis]RJX71477.1 helix-turn-helix transcriptional regulator [Vibrio sinensis]